MALQRPNSVFYTQRPMDEETLALPPRSEKPPSPPKNVALTVWNGLTYVFRKPASAFNGLNARPAQIRESLARLLIDNRGLKTGEANRIVSSWTVGSGLELRQYGAIMYLDLFGNEYGWILYREVKVGVRQEKRPIVRYPLHTVTIISASIMVATITLLARLDFDEVIDVVVTLLAVLSTLTFVVCMGLQWWGTSEGKMVERELRAATKKAITLRQEQDAIGRDTTSW